MSTIKLRRGTAAEWTSVDPILAEGEPGVEKDTGKMKIGNGTTTWKNLPYSASKGDPGAPGAAGPAGPAGAAGPAGPSSVTTVTGTGVVTVTENTPGNFVVSSSATSNSTDAQLRDRSTHTGTQAISTVTGLQTALDGKVKAPPTGVYVWQLFPFTDPNVTRPAVDTNVRLNWVGPAGSGGSPPTNLGVNDTWDLPS